MVAKTMFEKIWDAHLVKEAIGQPSVLYVDLHLVHEVTSPQAFEGLRLAGREVRRPDLTVAVVDHNTPTWDLSLPITDPIAKQQLDALAQNCEEFNVPFYDRHSPSQGIVHVIGPEKGYTQPGKIIVCGDSHTSTHGAFGSFALGIGTSEVEHVLATQTLRQFKPKTMEIRIDVTLPKGVTAKDIILFVIGKIGTAGATGYVIEYSGSAIRSLSMEGRMTICNMSIEMGARGGMIAPDEITYEYIRGKEFAPKNEKFDESVQKWNMLKSDEDAVFDKVLKFDAEDIEPMITYGTNPGMGIKISEVIPNSAVENSNESFKKSLKYMGLKSGDKLLNHKIDYVFIGSCTNSRIEDLRLSAKIVKGKTKAKHVSAWVIPGSKKVEKLAIDEGLNKIFMDAGFEFRQPGCSACLAMNEDKIPKDNYCVSTSNRNFEGRQGPGSRTFLASPVTAAISALNGCVSDIREHI